MELLFNDAQFPPKSVPAQTYLWFTDELTKRTDGLLKFEHVGANALTKPGEEITALQTGLCDVGAATGVYYPTKAFVNAGITRSVPFDVYDFKTGSEILYKMYYEVPAGKVLHDEFALEGVTLLLMTTDPSYVIESKKPITTLDDLKGLKIGVLGGFGPKWLEAAGASSLAHPIGDRVTAMQTGVLDASATPIDISFPFGIYEFGPNWINTRWGVVTGNAVLWNTDKFNALPKDIQDIIIQTGKDAFLHNIDAYIGWEKNVVEPKVKEAGVVDHGAFSDADVNKWAQMIGEPVADWVKEAEGLGRTGAADAIMAYIQLCKDAGVKFPKEWKIK